MSLKIKLHEQSADSVYTENITIPCEMSETQNLWDFNSDIDKSSVLLNPKIWAEMAKVSEPAHIAEMLTEQGAIDDFAEITLKYRISPSSSFEDPGASWHKITVDSLPTEDELYEIMDAVLDYTDGIDDIDKEKLLSVIGNMYEELKGLPGYIDDSNW